ncbi:MAG: outer membrane protein assembly factor BamD, partial [Rhizobiales bacterium]|nr:outer membrane protein assembly factor BamD [Hyphomicrobiales bacterium]
LERQHPYSKFTQKGMMHAIDSYFKIRAYDDVAYTADRYIILYPRAHDVKKAYYLRSEAYYIRIADIKRDQEITVKAQKALKSLIRKFPSSKEGKLARKKLLITYDLLAAKELEVGRYYLGKRNFPAAINRFKEVVDKYETTKQIEEALARLVESYLALGLRDEAKANAALLGRNYRSGEWYGYAYTLLNKS